MRHSPAKGFPAARDWRTALFPHSAVWTVTALLLPVIAAWTAVADIRISASGIYLLYLAGGAACFAGGVMLARRGYSRPHMALMTLAFFILFGTEARVLNYLFVTLGAPWRDAALARADAALGFDWLAYVSWVNRHAAARDYLQIFYDSHKLLFAVTLGYLAIKRMRARLREFLLLFMATALATVVIGGFFPAVGGFAHYAPDSALTGNLSARAGRYFLPHLLPLHAGHMHHIDLGNMTGLTAFPSFHTVMALMVIHALRGTPLVAVFSILCLGMIAATPVFGGHYLADVIAGAALFTLAAIMLRRLAPEAPQQDGPSPAASCVAQPAE